MKSRLLQTSVEGKKSQYFKVGWAKENITPDHPLPIASYGLRDDYEAVHDSIWVRTFVFDNGSTKAAIITLDLLIFPPILSELLQEKLPEGFNICNIHLSATHTHNSAGGWAEGLGGRILAGPRNEKYIQKVLSAIIASIEKADSSVEEAEIGFDKLNASYLVRNRLVKGESVDPWIRVVKIKTKSDRVGLITTFSAHPTTLSSREDNVSGDYPGKLVKLLENDKKVDFALFMAGAVGSQALHEYGKSNYELLDFVAERINNKIIDQVDSIKLGIPEEMSFLKLPLELREPHVKFLANLRLRPALYYWLLGRSKPTINILEIGDILFVGTPCDFSGSLVAPLERFASKKGKELIITSFNGGYIGYITEDKYYNLNKSETREMNWFGPQNGDYFSEIIYELIKKIQDRDHQN